MNFPLKRISLFAFAVMLAACDDETPSNKITITSASPLTLTEGQTSDQIQVSKTSVDVNGKENTISDYGHFTLVSDDTNIVAVVLSSRLLGKAPGQTTVTAHDDASSLVSEKLSVTVNPKSAQ
jgi:hypothetical protein